MNLSTLMNMQMSKTRRNRRLLKSRTIQANTFNGIICEFQLRHVAINGRQCHQLFLFRECHLRAFRTTFIAACPVTAVYGRTMQTDRCFILPLFLPLILFFPPPFLLPFGGHDEGAWPAIAIDLPVSPPPGSVTTWSPPSIDFLIFPQPSSASDPFSFFFIWLVPSFSVLLINCNVHRALLDVLMNFPWAERVFTRIPQNLSRNLTLLYTSR